MVFCEKFISFNLDLKQILSTPTPKHFVHSRINFQMEKNLKFILEKVEWGKDLIFINWFQQLYFSNPITSISLFSDFTRLLLNDQYKVNTNNINLVLIPRFALLGKILISLLNQTVIF